MYTFCIPVPFKVPLIVLMSDSCGYKVDMTITVESCSVQNDLNIDSFIEDNINKLQDCIYL